TACNIARAVVGADGIIVGIRSAIAPRRQLGAITFAAVASAAAATTAAAAALLAIARAILALPLGGAFPVAALGRLVVVAVFVGADLLGL
ncbi:hypothetical protein ABTM85_20195, partial [Acinetobacter baumannii]